MKLYSVFHYLKRDILINLIDKLPKVQLLNVKNYHFPKSSTRPSIFINTFHHEKNKHYEIRRY